VAVVQTKTMEDQKVLVVLVVAVLVVHLLALLVQVEPRTLVAEAVDATELVALALWLFLILPL
jgi:hypothetical protein